MDIRSVREQLAATGKLRVGINVGNPVLASLDPAGGEPLGVSVDLARELASRIGVEPQFVVFPAAGLSVQALVDGRTDLGFFAVDPARAAHVAFTRPYVLIEGAYLVRDASAIRTPSEVDQSGNRVVVGQASAYDLFLTRHLGAARIIRAASSPAVVDCFLAGSYEVAAGVRQQLQSDAGSHPGLRLLDQSFMVIRQALGVSGRLDRSLVDYLDAFVQNVIASGFVAATLRMHGISGVSIADD